MALSRISRTLLFSAVAIVLCGAEAPPDSAPSAATDACSIIAAAKFKQWGQPRLMIKETVRLDDGALRNDETIVDANTAYATGNALSPTARWITAQVTISERRPPSADQVQLAMGLAKCTMTGHTQEGGVAATSYSFTYLPNADGSVSEGAIWISDATGLPLRQQLKENGELANARVARAIDATYVYDFAVPRAAERAQMDRLFGASLTVRGIQGLLGIGAGNAR